MNRLRVCNDRLYGSGGTGGVYRMVHVGPVTAWEQVARGMLPEKVAYRETFPPENYQRRREIKEMERMVRKV